MSYPVLIAGSNYVKVDVRNMGNNFGPPDNMPVFYQGPAYSGQEFTGIEGGRLCARREAIPGNPNSPYTNQWFCASGFTDTEVGEPVTTTF